ncbi:MAG: ABC transporter ATP-binding protein [Bacillota bacterium]
MSFLKKYTGKYLKPFCAGVACLMMEAFCDLLQPTIMSRIIDVGVAGKRISYVLRAGGLMLAVAAVGAAAAVGRNILASTVSQRFGRDLRSDLFRKIQEFSFDNIDRFDTASLVTRLTNDVTQVQNFVNGIMRVFVKAPLLCIGGVIMATLLNPSLAVVLAAVVPMVGILIYTSMRIGYPFFARVQKSLDRVNGVMREYLSGVRVVKAFNRFNYEEERFTAANQDLTGVTTKAMRAMALFSPCIALAVNLGIAAVLWYGGVRVNRGSIHAGEIIAFINYMTQILFSLMMISFIFTMFVRAKASSERIDEVFAAEDTMPAALYPVKLPDAKGGVAFEHVYFSYAGAAGEPVLKDVNFSCEHGKTIGIIGSTGAGKSSLVYLIPRFYDASAGAVLVDGVNVKNAEQAGLRQRIAIVPQRTVLFTGSILENIRWGKADATLEEVEEAAAAAQARDFILSFPEGYATLLGQGGVNLSGGQKQRIAIARALVRKPEILILDDSTSAVDVATEARIREALKVYTGGLTCFIIAQRITSVMSADYILVMDRGEIVGAGTHGELAETCDVYRDIFRSQLGREAV